MPDAALPMGGSRALKHGGVRRGRRIGWVTDGGVMMRSKVKRRVRGEQGEEKRVKGAWIQVFLKMGDDGEAYLGRVAERIRKARRRRGEAGLTCLVLVKTSGKQATRGGATRRRCQAAVAVAMRAASRGT